MGQHIIGMERSGALVRVAVIEASLRRAQLVDVRTIEVSSEATAADAWVTVREALRVPVDSVVVAADAKLGSSRLLSFPFTDVRKVPAAVEFELEGQIPYALSEVATSFCVTTRTEARLDVLAALTPRVPFLGQLAALFEAQLEPRAVVLPAVALAEFLPRDASFRTAIVSLGATETHVCVGRDGLQFLRTLRVGGDDVDRSIAKKLGLSLIEAKARKHAAGRVMATDAGSATLDPLEQAVLEGLQPLVQNLLTSFKSMPPGQAPERVLLTGGLSRLVGLPEFLARRLGVGVGLLDVRAAFAAVGGVSDKGGPEHAVAMGLALSLFRHGRDVPLNFRRGELSYSGDFQLYRGQLTRIAVGLACVFVLAIFSSVVRYTMLHAEEQEIEQGFCDATKRIVGREICDPTAALATLKQAPGAEGTIIPSFSASSLFEMVSNTISQQVDVQLEELDLRVDATANVPDRITGKGEAASFEATEQIVAMLKRDACVQDAEVQKLQRTQGGRVSFTMNVKVLCPAGVRPGVQVQAMAGAQASGPSATPTKAPPLPGAPADNFETRGPVP